MPFVVQVADPKHERLFGETASIGGYELEGTTYLIGLDYPGGASIARWRPEWGGGDIEAGVVHEGAGLAMEQLEEWGRDAARFVVVLGLLLDAVQTPLKTADEGPQLPGRRKGKPRPERPWTIRRVTISGDAERRGAGGGTGGESDTNDLLGRSVMVRGHLKRQPYGPGGKLRRWVYVESYEARRWFTAKPTKILVS